MKALLVHFAKMTALITFLIVMSAPSFAQQKQVTYYHVNTQGSPVAATNELAEIKWRQEYTNFGLQAISSGQPDDVNQSSFGLTGHVEDQFDELSLVYMQARYYDPSLGRFLSIDGAGFDDTNPQSFNRYAYANNNPHRYVDPDGNIIFLAPFVYSAATFLAKEVAVEVVSNYVPAVQYLGIRKSVTVGVKALLVKRVSPNGIKFSQPTISQNFSSKGTINDLVEGLKSGSVKPRDVPPIRVVKLNGELITLDNRRLAAFQAAGKKIRVERVSLSNSEIAKEFGRKNNPVNGGQNIVVIPNRKAKGAAKATLRAHGKIE